jgi:hypothetical protein
VARPTQQQRIEALLEKFDPVIREAFLASIKDIVDRARLNVIITALERGDIDSAVRATHVETAAFQPMDAAIRQAFLEGGATTAATMPPMKDPAGATMVFRFDVRMPAAENWLTSHSSTAITGIVDDQRTAIRTALTEGMAQGNNPRTTALDIVGRTNVATGRREGGIVGLTSQQTDYVINARRELLSGDPAQMRNYLGRQRRDKRFDAQVLKAIKEGQPLDQATVTRMTGRYADRLLQLRGETVGRTESMTAINASREEAWQQAVKKGNFPAVSVRRTWHATQDARTRDSHRHLNGETVGLNEHFSNGLRYPGDPSGPLSEIANCRCRLNYRRDYFSNLQ